MDGIDNRGKKVQGFTYVNGVLVYHDTKDKSLEWKSLMEDQIYQSLLGNLGIGFMNSMYIETNKYQNKEEEYAKILAFLQKYMEYHSKKYSIPFEDLRVEFINYGKTELVYILTEKNGRRLTLLVKQPAVSFGAVYQEMQYLLELRSKDENVVAPIDYFQLDAYELYVTPYINQARCVASDYAWGMYIPEPYYRFESFTKQQEKVVNVCMIAKLVSLYDFQKQEGIACCKLGGGDFMLAKGWELEKPIVENTLSQLYLIAARKKIKCSFDDYLKILRDEFSRATIAEDQDKLMINLRGRVPMEVSSIEAGIILGQDLLSGKKPSSSLIKSLIL